MPSWRSGGNRTTALRWARVLRQAGWRVVRDSPRGTACPDLILALHARKSRQAVRALCAAHPGARLVVAATGTDLYLDLPGGGDDAAVALAGFAAADRIIVLQELGKLALPGDLRPRARVVHQGTPRVEKPARAAGAPLQAVMLAGVRAVKDPLTVVRALAGIHTADLRLDHHGPVLDEGLAAELEQASDRGGPYRFRGSLSRRDALCALARADLLVSPSLQEGGANVVTEAFATGTAVLAARSDGAVGLLGDDHPGLFEAGDVAGLAALLCRCRDEPGFLEELATRSRARAHLADPAGERRAWHDLLDELGLGGPP